MNKRVCLALAALLLALVLIFALLATCPASQCKTSQQAVQMPLAPDSNAQPFYPAVAVTPVETPAPVQVPLPPQ